MQAYSDPARESDPHALPDVEVFHIAENERASICDGEGEWHTQQPGTRKPCEQCPPAGWYYWFCFPGCMPSSDIEGPFDSEADALEDAQDGAE